MKKMCNKKSILLLALVVVIALGSVGGTLAYLLDRETQITNTFIPAQVSSTVVETFTGGDLVKTNVKIKNTSTNPDVDAFIRAYVVVTWQNSEGKVHSTLPALGTDYIMTLGSGWFDNDGIYYWPSVVEAGHETGVLITSCEVKKPAPEAGYTLHVEIMGSAIQAEGKIGDTWAVEEAWGVTVNDTDPTTVTDNTISK